MQPHSTLVTDLIKDLSPQIFLARSINHLSFLVRCRRLARPSAKFIEEIENKKNHILNIFLYLIELTDWFYFLTFFYYFGPVMFNVATHTGKKNSNP